VCSLSSFFKYLAGSAAELRLPVNMPNPAHSQFIARSSADPVVETPALTLSQARQLQEMPKGDDLIAWRDRAIIDFYLYTGARIATGCSLTVADFTTSKATPPFAYARKATRPKLSVFTGARQTPSAATSTSRSSTAVRFFEHARTHEVPHSQKQPSPTPPCIAPFSTISRDFRRRWMEANAVTTPTFFARPQRRSFSRRARTSARSKNCSAIAM
jgi:hypothetical protein